MTPTEPRIAHKVLLVDDDDAVRTMMSLTLEHKGFEVVPATNVTEALKLITTESFDVLITDLNMPNMDGIQMIAAIRKLPGYPFTPILMLTTESQAGKKDEGRKAGATGWIVKPFDGEKLIAAVQKLVK